MLDHFTREQLKIVQEMLFENAVSAGVPVSPVFHIRCNPCQFCMTDHVRCVEAEYQAAHPCDWCGGSLVFELDGSKHCDDSECRKVREFYGVQDVKMSGKQTKEHRKRRTDAAMLFAEDGKQKFNRLTFEQLKLGMLLEFKTVINETVKQLREVANGTDRTGNTGNTEHGKERDGRKHDTRNGGGSDWVFQPNIEAGQPNDSNCSVGH